MKWIFILLKKYFIMSLKNDLILEKLSNRLLKLHLRKFFLFLFGFVFLIFFKIKNNIKIYNFRNSLRRIQAPFILILNHSSWADYFLALTLFPLILLYHPRDDFTVLNSKDDWNDRKLRIGLNFLGAIPRKGSGEEIVGKCVGALKQGKFIVITPEGAHNRGRLMTGFSGIVRIFYESNKDKLIPIIPLGIWGANQAFPPFKRNFPINRIQIKMYLGQPFILKKYEILTYEKIRLETNKVMMRLARIAKQDTIVESYFRSKLKKKGRRNW